MSRQTTLLAAKIAVTLALGLWLFRLIDFERLQRVASGLGAGRFLAALALLTTQAGLISVRWHTVLRVCRGSLGFAVALRWVFIGLFFNQALPTSVGGDAVRIWLLRRSGSAAPGTAFASVAIERLTGIAVLGLMVSICVPPYWYVLPSPVNIVLASTGPALFILLFLLAFADRLPFRWLPQRLLPSVVALAQGLRALARAPRNLVAVIALGIVASLCGLGAAFLLGRDLGVAIEWGGVIVALGGSVLVSVLPISIGGWGVREASLVALYGSLGVAPESALAVSVLWALMQLLVSLPGGLLWWWEARPDSTRPPDAQQPQFGSPRPAADRTSPAPLQ